MEQYIYVIIICSSIFLCPFCFLSFEINICPKIQGFFEKTKKIDNNENNLNENLIEN